LIACSIPGFAAGLSAPGLHVPRCRSENPARGRWPKSCALLHTAGPWRALFHQHSKWCFSCNTVYVELCYGSSCVTGVPVRALRLGRTPKHEYSLMQRLRVRFYTYEVVTLPAKLAQWGRSLPPAALGTSTPGQVQTFATGCGAWATECRRFSIAQLQLKRDWGPISALCSQRIHHRQRLFFSPADRRHSRHTGGVDYRETAQPLSPVAIFLSRHRAQQATEAARGERAAPPPCGGAANQATRWSSSKSNSSTSYSRREPVESLYC